MVGCIQEKVTNKDFSFLLQSALSHFLNWFKNLDNYSFFLVSLLNLLVEKKVFSYHISKSFFKQAYKKKKVFYILLYRGYPVSTRVIVILRDDEISNNEPNTKLSV